MGGRVVCIGSAPLDLVMIGLDGLPERGRLASGEAIIANPGGMANVAVALARLEQPVELLSAIGDDGVGEQLCELLRNEGVIVPPPRAGQRTDVTLSMPWGGDRALVSYQHAGTPIAPDAAAGYWSDVAAICVDVGCGLDPRLRMLARRGIPIIGDLGGAQDPFCRASCIESLSDVAAFLPNEQEALVLTGAEDVGTALEQLRRRAGTVLVKRGEHGVLAQRGEERVAVAAPPAANVDSTGAGDILDGGFTVGLLRGLSLADAAALGCLAASVSVTRTGSSLSAPTWHDLRRFVENLDAREREDWERMLAAAGRGDGQTRQHAEVD
ncbi:MAG: carbohydrate kinase family protein [Candidatus Dormiibacterota bacterium]